LPPCYWVERRKSQKAGALADKGFSLELDDRLASLAQLFPGIEPQMLAADAARRAAGAGGGRYARA
jgi:hypothetical protein